MDLFEQVPGWLLRPLPASAVFDNELLTRIDQLALQLPGSLWQIRHALDGVGSLNSYDPASNRACAHVWLGLERFYQDQDPSLGRALLGFASHHMPQAARAKVYRLMASSPHRQVRTEVGRLVRRDRIREVALPLRPESPWDATGWLRGNLPRELSRHPQGRRIQEKHGVPALANVAELRKLLGIVSAKQLGYFLLASAAEKGPYTTFTVPKSDGSPRTICAPKDQLRSVQRRLLDRILNPLAVHPAAHGFVAGRSTVTNAACHQGAALLVKFDLKDFFPTINFYRVLGLFARLGYTVGNAQFGTADRSPQVAPTLARLCCYTPNPSLWRACALPQGAPTSPALTNLICRRLDARLTGLATASGGVYTRYADDLTFSFRTDGLNLGRFRWWVDQVCHQEGFLVRQDKFRVIRASQRQLVTGIVVNEELRIPREARRRFRAILHNCRRHGVESQGRGHPRFTDYLRGFASYVHMVHPEEGEEMLRQVDELLGRSSGEEVP